MRKATFLGWVLAMGACSIANVAAINVPYQAVGYEKQAVMQDDIRRIISKLYPDARILDRDTDNGMIEIKISHNGYEKIALFDPGNKHWLRTIWEIRRERLPKKVLNRLAKEGIDFKYIDDNDNQAMQNGDGFFFAVQAEKGDHDYVFIISESGKIIRKYIDREWDDDRWRGDFDMVGSFDEDDRWDDGEDHFDEGDDEWDDRNHRANHRRDRWDDGEDRFDEGDDEWDNSRRKIRYHDDGEDHFDEGDDEWEDGED